MRFAADIFWNRSERRPRALWRLIAQAILLVLAVLLLQVARGILFRSVPSISGQDTGRAGPTLLTRTLLAFTPLFSVGLSVWLAGRFLDRRPFAGFGFHINSDWWIDLGFGLLLGALLMAGVFLIQLALGWIRVVGTFVTQNPMASFSAAILSPLAIFTAVGIYEELIARGYQLQNMAEGLAGIGPRAAIVIAALVSSAIFGGLHALNPNASILSTAFIFIAALVFLGLGYVLTGELAIPIGTHITWNYFQGHVFGFAVSGARLSNATFIQTGEQGPDLWTGGAFGPEAGLIGLLAAFVGGALIVAWIRWRYGRAGLATRLAQSPPSARTGPCAEVTASGSAAT